MDAYLNGLIDRMGFTGDNIAISGVFDSSITISWQAMREAEKINDASLMPQLVEYIQQEKDKKKRGHAYFVLGHICKNVNKPEIIQFLINRVSKEENRYLLSTLLNRIAVLEKPSNIDIKPIINACKSEKWLIRHSAIGALKHTQSEDAETALISIINTSLDPYDLCYANNALSTSGTQKAIPYLEKHIKSRKRDVKASPINAINEINKRFS